MAFCFCQRPTANDQRRNASDRDPRQNEKATLAKGRPLLLGRIVPTGQKSVKTFWRNLMSRKRGSSRDFWEINTFVFYHLENRLTGLRSPPFPASWPGSGP